MSSALPCWPLCCMWKAEAQRGQGWLLGTTRMGDTTTDSRPGLSQFNGEATLGQTGWGSHTSLKGRGVSTATPLPSGLLGRPPHHLGDPVTGGGAPGAPAGRAHSMPSPHTEHLARTGLRPHAYAAHTTGGAQLSWTPTCGARPPWVIGDRAGGLGPTLLPQSPQV